MKTFWLRRLACAVLLVLPSTALASQPSARGFVLSPSGSPVPGARAELLSLPGSFEQGRSRLAGDEPPPVAVATTGPLGRYTLAAPGPGVFMVRVTAPGMVPLQSGPLPLVGEIEVPAAVPLPDAGGRLVLRNTAGNPLAGLSIFAEARARPALPGDWRIAPRVGRTAGDGSLALPRSAGDPSRSTSSLKRVPRRYTRAGPGERSRPAPSPRPRTACGLSIRVARPWRTCWCAGARCSGRSA